MSHCRQLGQHSGDASLTVLETHLAAPLPEDEAERLATLRRYAILDTSPEACFERVVQIAARAFDVPIALVSLVDEDRQWFKARHGIDACETGRDVAFCAHAILADDILVVPDATKDARFSANPLVTSGPEIRFYAGAPLIASNGKRLGTLCVIDMKPRSQLDEAEQLTLQDLAAIVVEQFEMRIASSTMLNEVEARLFVEEKLAIKEQQLALFIKHAPAAIAMFDRDMRYLAASERWRTDLRLGDGLLEHRCHYEVLPTICDGWRDDHRRCLEGEVLSIEDDRFEHADGTIDWMRRELHPWRNAQGEIGGVIILSETITEKRAVALELDHKKVFLEAVLDNVQEAVVACDTDGNVTVFNAAARDLYDIDKDCYSFEQWKSHNRLYASDPTTSNGPDQLPLFRALEGEIVRNQGVAKLCDDTDIRKLTVNARPIVLSEGQTIGAVSSSRDETDLHASSIALEASHERLKTSYNHTPAMMYSVDTDGRIVSVSDYWLEVLGYEREDVLGKKCVDFFSDGSLEKSPHVMLPEFRRFGCCKDIEYQFRKKTGEAIDVLLSAVAERDDNGDIQRTLAVLTDVTESRRLEQSLGQAQKMEAVGQLTGGLAHDFNNLLAVIMGNLQMLERSVDGDIRASKRVRSALRATERGADLTKRLLAFSRRQQLDAEDVDTGPLIGGMIDMLERTLGESIELELSQTDGPASVVADRSQLESAILNLAINARDAMPSGGRLTIETSQAVFEPECAAKIKMKPGDYVRISVTDTGTGIPKNIVDQVFTPFFTTKEEGKGTGLGLSMVYGFVKQSSGNVTIHSEEGCGTTINLFLPRAIVEGEQVQQRHASDDCLNGSGKVLVVEDKEDVREMASAMLEDLGYETLEAENGSQALDIMKSTAIDLLFTDVVMPGGMSGPELASLARRRNPSLKVLFTSGYAEAAVLREGGVTSRTQLIAKPYRKAELATKVHHAISAG